MRFRSLLVLVTAACGCASPPAPQPATASKADVPATTPSPPIATAAVSSSDPSSDEPFDPPPVEDTTEAQTPIASTDTPAAAPSEPQPSAAEKRACAARGGKIQPVCMLGHLECVIHFRDGGKRCTDKKQCIGECRYEGDGPAPASPIGACQRTSDPCGCKAPIVDGHVTPALCVD